MDFTITGLREDLAAIEKRRKGKARERDDALTAAHAAEEAGMEAMRGENGRSDGDAEAEAARKAISDIGCTDGPGMFGEPGMIEPGDFRRGPLDSGHAAISPQHAAPNVPPMPPQGRGILEPVPMPGLPEVVGHNGPILAGMMQHQARATATMPSMPIPRGAA